MAVAHAYKDVVNHETGRVYRIGESDKDILGYSRWVVIIASWVALGLAGLLEYTWGAVSGNLIAMNGWSHTGIYWLFSVYTIFEATSQIFTGMARSAGLITVRWAVILGGIVAGIVAFGWLNMTHSLLAAYLSFGVLGGIGSGAVYNTTVNIVGRWYPEKKGWRTGFVNGAWAYGSVPFVLVIGMITGSADHMTTAQTHEVIWVMGIIMSAVIVLAGILIKDPPKNWWPDHIDPLNWTQDKRPPADLKNNPPAPHQYNIKEMWHTPQAKWLGIQFALFIGAGLFGVSYFFAFAKAMHLGTAAAAVSSAGFALADGIGRPLAGLWSEHWGRRKVMATCYALLAIFQALAFFSGYAHNSAMYTIFAFLCGALSGVNFPLTAALVSDYYGENNNSGMYGTVYAWKALGGGFAGGIAAIIMTGSAYGNGTFHWERGFIFGIVLCFLSSLVMGFLCKRPTIDQVKHAVAKASGRSVSQVEAEWHSV